MPELFHSLQGRDLGHLRIVADLWGIELNAPDTHTALPTLTNAMLNQALLLEVVETLPDDARDALGWLAQNEGRALWSIFSRRFGNVREMGPGRRDRERPYLSPASPTEFLWYRGLIARAFLKTGDEPQEYAYIPDDFLPWLPLRAGGQPEPPGRPASPLESSQLTPVDERILDHTCTLLAALRVGLGDSNLDASAWGMPIEALQTLLASAGLLDSTGLPLPDPTRAFLEAYRGESLAQLVTAWLGSTLFNELRQTPGLRCEGEWRNDPLSTRRALLSMLNEVPPNTWWSLAAFVSGVHERQPDFQRTAGDYDAWYIRLENTGEFLRGIETWDAVEGELIRFIITGPMHWLGIMDVASSIEGGPVTAFKFSPWASSLLKGTAPTGLSKENAPMQVTSDGRVRLSPLTPRSVRYLAARFCQWEGEDAREYRYRLTPASLERARSQGLRVSHLQALLRRSAGSIPPALGQALDRWENNGVQAALERVYILRVTSAEILTNLRKSPAGRFLGDPLSSTTVIVKENAIEKVQAALSAMGYLAYARFDG